MQPLISHVSGLDPESSALLLLEGAHSVQKPIRREHFIVSDFLAPARILPAQLPPTNAAEYVWAAKQLTSAQSSPVRPSASGKSTTTSNWSALWIVIWDTSIWRLACWNRWKIPSAQKCYLCSRYALYPMCPGGALKEMARLSGFPDLSLVVWRKGLPRSVVP